MFDGQRKVIRLFTRVCDPSIPKHGMYKHANQTFHTIHEIAVFIVLLFISINNCTGRELEDELEVEHPTLGSSTDTELLQNTNQ